MLDTAAAAATAVDAAVDANAKSAADAFGATDTASVLDRYQQYLNTIGNFLSDSVRYGEEAFQICVPLGVRAGRSQNKKH